MNWQGMPGSGGTPPCPPDLRESLGITGRIHRFNWEDIKSGKALNPFAESASATMPLRDPIPTPFAWTRGKALEGEGIMSMIRPNVGRTGRLWRAALEVSHGTDASIERGVNRIRKETGIGALSETEAEKAASELAKGPVIAELAQMTDEELAAYPFMLMTTARRDSLTRTAAKGLRTAAIQTEHQVSGILSNAEAEDAGRYLLAGAGDDVRPTVIWDKIKQRSLDAADNANTGAGGQIKDRLAKAVDTALRKSDMPVDLERLSRGSHASVIAMKAFDDIVQDPDFGTEIRKIATEFADHLGPKGLTEDDLLRASLNAISTATSISKETDGIFHWVGSFGKSELAKELFSPQGAEALGLDAKLLHYSEQMGIAVADRGFEEASTPEIAGFIQQQVDEITGVAAESGVNLEKMLQTRAELTRGLKAKGLTEDQIAKIENDLATNVIDRAALSDSLFDAARQAAEIAGDAVDTDALLKLQRKAVRDAERLAQQLEETHLAILDYREMDATLQEQLADLRRAQQAVDLVAVNMDPAISRLHELVDEVPESEYLPAQEAMKGPKTKASYLLNIGLGDSPVANITGERLQDFNRALGLARDLFGDAVDLAPLAEHAPATAELTRGFDMTEGALNQASIARFFQETAHADVTAVADRFGGWFQVLADNNEEAIAEIRRVGKNVKNRRASMGLGMTSVGVTERQVAEFVTTTLADRFNAMAPLVDAVTGAMDSNDFGRLESIAVGDEGGMRILAQLQGGDLSYLQMLGDELFRGLDVGIGLVGGFGDVNKFEMMREIIRDPDNAVIKASFDRMIEVMETFQRSAGYIGVLTETKDTHQVIMDEVGNLLKPMRRAERIASKRDDLVDEFLQADLGAATRDLEITTEQRDALRATLAGAKDRAASLRRELGGAGRVSERLRVAHGQRLKDLETLDHWIGLYEELLDNQSAEAWDSLLRVHQVTEVTQNSTLMSRLLEGSRDFQTVSRGVIDFIRDPQVAFKEVGGEMVRRSDDEILKMWKRRTDGMVKWLETFKDRAVNGYVTKGGKEVGPITRYDEARIIHEEWLNEQFNQGFKHVWGGAALADKGGARAMVAIATNYPKGKVTEWGAAYDYLIDMLKAGYVGTAGFSNNNLIGATQENVRQGIDPRVSTKVWGADKASRDIAGVTSFLATLDGQELDDALEVLRQAQKAAEDHYGSNVLRLVEEARGPAGIAETSFFEETTGSVVEGIDESLKGMLKSWRPDIREARKLGMLDVEAKYGSSPILERFAGVTSALGQIPTHPARWYERKLAGKIERIASRNWDKLIDDPEVLRKLDLLLEAAEPYTARPGVEGLVRVDLYTQRRLAGDSLEMAHSRVMASHFDYSDLSSADRTMKRIIPFWTWRSRSINHYYEMLASKPSVLGHTLALWREEHRTKDARAPMGAQEPGNIFSGALGIQGRITDPSLDLVKLLDQTGQGIQDNGVVLGLFNPLAEAIANDTAAPLSAAFIATSGYTPEGVTIGTPIAIQKPLDEIASAPGGAGFVDRFAHRGKGGKWYWDSPEAPYLLSEALPMFDNIVRIIKPSVEEKDPGAMGYLEAALGTLTQFLGSPIKPVSDVQMQKNQATTMIQRRFAAAEKRQKASYDN
jgi:hypothetical protein